MFHVLNKSLKNYFFEEAFFPNIFMAFGFLNKVISLFTVCKF